MTEIFKVGSLKVETDRETRDDGGHYDSLRVRLGKTYTTLDRYEANALKLAIEVWLQTCALDDGR